MRARQISVCVLFITLAVAACGGDKAKSTSAPTTSVAPTAAAPAATTTTVAGADMAVAMKLVLVASDFPPGWTSKPGDQTRSADANATSTELNSCAGTSGEEAQTARWNGDTFKSDQYKASADASLVKDDAIFRKDLAALQSPKVQPCVKDVFTKVLTKQLGRAPSAVDAASLDVPKHGDATVAIRLTVNAGSAASDAVYLDMVLMGKNRAEVTETLLSARQPMVPALENSLVDALGRRVDAA